MLVVTVVASFVVVKRRRRRRKAVDGAVRAGVDVRDELQGRGCLRKSVPNTAAVEATRITPALTPSPPGQHP